MKYPHYNTRIFRKKATFFYETGLVKLQLAGNTPSHDSAYSRICNLICFLNFQDIGGLP